MHLLEDTTSPQHVRNEQHLPPVWKSPIEKWGSKNVAHLNYGTVQCWTGAAMVSQNWKICGIGIYTMEAAQFECG